MNLKFQIKRKITLLAMLFCLGQNFAASAQDAPGTSTLSWIWSGVTQGIGLGLTLGSGVVGTGMTVMGWMKTAKDVYDWANTAHSVYSYINDEFLASPEEKADKELQAIIAKMGLIDNDIKNLGNLIVKNKVELEDIENELSKNPTATKNILTLKKKGYISKIEAHEANLGKLLIEMDYYTQSYELKKQELNKLLRLSRELAG